MVIRKAAGIASLSGLKTLPKFDRLAVGKGEFPEAELQGFDPRVKIFQR